MTIAYAPAGFGGKNKAENLARHADMAIVFAGLTRHDEGEYFPLICGGDRKTLELPPGQERLIRRIRKSAKKLVVVLQGGGAIACGSWIGQADALLMAWYPGMEGGNAIADVLLGNVNPSGRLPLSFPHSTRQLPEFDAKARRVRYGPWHDYRYFDHNGTSPLFPFGAGLSYTRFTYSNLRISRPSITPDQSVFIRFDVTNTGEVPGVETGQLYVGHENPTVVPRPAKELKGFAKCFLLPGQTRTLEMTIKGRNLAHYHKPGQAWRVEPGNYGIRVGPSSADIRLCGTLRIRP